MDEIKINLTSTNKKRKDFLREIRDVVMNFTGERMKLDAIIHEIAKNIYDHAEGNGYLYLTKSEGNIYFKIGNASSTISKSNRTEGINFGVGLRIIKEMSEVLDIDLNVDEKKGFIYSGTYRLLRV